MANQGVRWQFQKSEIQGYKVKSMKMKIEGIQNQVTEIVLSCRNRAEMKENLSSAWERR